MKLSGCQGWLVVAGEHCPVESNAKSGRVGLCHQIGIRWISEGTEHYVGTVVAYRLERIALRILLEKGEPDGRKALRGAGAWWSVRTLILRYATGNDNEATVKSALQDYNDEAPIELIVAQLDARGAKGSGMGRLRLPSSSIGLNEPRPMRGAISQKVRHYQSDCNAPARSCR
jgi:hypothetical protein